MVACGGILAAVLFTAGEPLLGVIEFVVFAAFASLQSPVVFPRSLAAAEAQKRSADDGLPVVYWRPTCRYCLRLRFGLGRHARRAYWVDIWRDPAGAAQVRAFTGGDETVPTVVLEGQPFINPEPRWLRHQLA